MGVGLSRASSSSIRGGQRSRGKRGHRFTRTITSSDTVRSNRKLYKRPPISLDIV